MFNALVVESPKIEDIQLKRVDFSFLPKTKVLLKVHYSCLNYKDALALIAPQRIIKNYPLIPGIDLAGEVIESLDHRYKKGDLVVATGFGLGEKFMGGFSEFAAIDSEFLIPLPQGMTMKCAMGFGTAGLTAMLAVDALQKQGVSPSQGPILVTGANGGVGGMSIVLLAKLGYEVIASTGRTEEADYLKFLGAQQVIDRKVLIEKGKPLQKELWAGAIDTLGSDTLVNVCAGTKYNGVIAACGLAQGMDFNGSVAPFILRGIKLIGIDSVMQPYSQRVSMWQKIAHLFPSQLLHDMTKEIQLDEVILTAQQLLNGKIRGRIVIAL